MKEKIEKLKRLDNKKLIDVVKNYRQYGYEDEIRAAAISILEERGVSIEMLKLTGNYENKSYDIAGDLYAQFKSNSKIAFAFYGLLLITNVLVPLLGDGFEKLGKLALTINWSSFTLYLIFLVKSFINQQQFYKITGKKHGAEEALIFFLLGMPLYIFMFFYFGKQMKEEMNTIR